MQIRARLQSQLLPPHAANLPLNVVYDCGTIRKLSRYLTSVRKGQRMGKEDEIRLMHDLVKEYSAFNNASNPTQGPQTSPSSIPLTSHGHTVVLTGANGALGAHNLSLLRSSPHVSQIHCLVRAAFSNCSQRTNLEVPPRAQQTLPRLDILEDTMPPMQILLSQILPLGRHLTQSCCANSCDYPCHLGCKLQHEALELCQRSHRRSIELSRLRASVSQHVAASIHLLFLNS